MVDVVAIFDVLPPLKAFAVVGALVLFTRLVWGFGGFLTGLADEAAWKWAQKHREKTDER